MVVFGGEPAPWGQLVPSPRGSEPALYEPAVPPTCPQHRSTAVMHGQPRSVPVPSKLQDQPFKCSRTVLPKLAMDR
jgi:hypothetical protein